MRNVIIGLVLVIAAFAIYFFGFKKSNTTDEESIRVEVQEGEFAVHVMATGELRAKRSEKIRGPDGMRAARIYNVSLQDIIPEGTIVKEGDYVARLDRTDLDGRIKDVSAEIEKNMAQLTQARIDTAITLRGVRDQLINLQYSIKEKKLEVEQSKYEAPAVIGRIKMDLERTKRDFIQQETNYKLKQEQAIAQMKEILSSLEQTQRRFTQMMELSQKFTIVAPKPGMVIYEREWNGAKKGPGSNISPWDPIVAQLPDLSSMISKTYVNEVDINKVIINQEVEIRVDAFPENAYKGKVVEVANIGEQMNKFDSKVFEVTIELLETDTLLRPAMTTSNQIETKTLENVLFVPLETIHNNDSLTFVYKEMPNGKIAKQEIITDAFNENDIVIKYGLKKEETVLLSVPDNSDDLEVVYLSEEDRIAYEKEEEELKLKLQQQALRAAEARKEKEKANKLMSNQGGGSGAPKVIIQN